MALLRELPREHLGSLRLMLNQPIPSRARLEIWKLLLRHTSASGSTFSSAWFAGRQTVARNCSPASYIVERTINNPTSSKIIGV